MVNTVIVIRPGTPNTAWRSCRTREPSQCFNTRWDPRVLVQPRGAACKWLKLSFSQAQLGGSELDLDLFFKNTEKRYYLHAGLYTKIYFHHTNVTPGNCGLRRQNLEDSQRQEIGLVSRGCTASNSFTSSASQNLAMLFPPARNVMAVGWGWSQGCVPWDTHSLLNLPQGQSPQPPENLFLSFIISMAKNVLCLTKISITLN